jgi:hypothetical protein
MNIKRLNFEYLLGALLILILSGAIAQEEGIRGETRRLFMEPALCIILLMGVWSLISQKKWLIIGGIIAGTGVATASLNFFWDMPELRLLNMGILFVFCLASTGVAFQSLLLSSSVDVNKIIGAICIYLLLGLDWSFLYLFINMAIPNSFNGLSSTEIGNQLPELVYYSFVTITTLGYGDLTPVKPLARTVAFLEGFVGQFYVAVLVAWLVGMFLSSKDQNHKRP